MVFLNGMPLAVIELKSAAAEDATIWTAFRQLQTYKREIPSLFVYNEALIASDGLQARIGSLTADSEWFKPWRTVGGETEAPSTMLELEVMVGGVFEKKRFLKLLRHFIAFEHDTDSDRLIKLLAGYHQFHAVEQAIGSTIEAAGPRGRQAVRRGLAHAGLGQEPFDVVLRRPQVVLHPAMANPTLVCLTDRNDLDDQLFGQFARCSELLRQQPVQAESVAHLRQLLQVASGGVVFTTIQKFLPEERGARVPTLSDRDNIVVIADEAHRSQYDMIDGLARNLRDALPNASFIGFTGTPIEKHDANTRAVFGDYVSVYDIERAVRDGATVPIYYESRIAKLSLKKDLLPLIDAEFDEITEDEEAQRKEKIKTKWAALEALVGDPKRIEVIARDLVEHFDRRTEAMDGKAMVVCMSRRICVESVQRDRRPAARLARRGRREGPHQDRHDRVGLG